MLIAKHRLRQGSKYAKPILTHDTPTGNWIVKSDAATAQAVSRCLRLTFNGTLTIFEAAQRIVASVPRKPGVSIS